MDAVFALASNVAGTRYKDLPSKAIHVAKMDILDTLGTAIAGSTFPGSREVVEMVSEWGGKEQSIIISYGTRVPAPHAALANGTMPRAIDYEDTHDAAILHAGSSVVTAAFAVSELKGRVNGRDFIAAVASGIDLECRLGLATLLSPVESGMSYSSMYGYFGACAAASKIMNFNSDQTVNALGIAFSQMSGDAQCYAEGSTTKAMGTGFAAQAGVISALLAQKGITGARNFLEGQRGLYSTILQNKYHPEALTLELGRRFEVVNLSFKPYPSCRYTHAPIGAALSLINQHRFKPGDIEAVTVYIGKNADFLTDPIDRKRRPGTPLDAQFSIPWTVASAIVKKKVGVESFIPTAFSDPEVLRTADKIVTTVDHKLSERGIEASVVEIKTKDGTTYTKRIDFAKGNPNNPMNDNEIIDKFRDCASFSVKPLVEKNIDEVIGMVCDMEQVADVSTIIQLLG